MPPTIGTSPKPRRPANTRSNSPSMLRETANCRPSSAKCTVLPKHWWEGTDSDGKKRDISATTLEKPLGSGPYRIKEFAAGRSVVLERVKDYWGDEPAGADRPEQFRRTCASSSSATIWSRWKLSRPIRPTGSLENSAKQWATAYDFPAVAEKRVIKEKFPINNVRPDAGLRLQPAPRPVQGRAAAPGVQLRVRFRGNEQAVVLRRHTSASTAISTAPSWPVRGFPKARNCRFSKPCATRCPPRSSRRPIPIRSAAMPEAVRGNLREGVRLLKEAGFADQAIDKLVDAVGQTGQRRIPDAGSVRWNA